MTDIFAQIAANAAASIPEEPEDYTVAGLLYCGKCRTPKETAIMVMNKPMTVRCLCQCGKEASDRERAERKRQERAIQLDRMRSVGMTDRTQRESTFANADGRNQKYVDFCKQYCDAWPKNYRDNIGLMLRGGVGTGKSFLAACIANEVMDRYLADVMMTNFSRVLNGLFSAQDKNGYIEDLVRYPLLIIDDLGIERGSDYALEQIFNVLDARARVRKPLIVTTNLTKAEMEEPKDVMHRRIFSRVGEMCLPVEFGLEDGRKAAAQRKREQLRENMKGST